jgi:hypothetical protein
LVGVSLRVVDMTVAGRWVGVGIPCALCVRRVLM